MKLSIGPLVLFTIVSRCLGMTAEDVLPQNTELFSSLGLFCDFETPCGWNYTKPTAGEAGFQNVSLEYIRRQAEISNKHTFIGPGNLPGNASNGKCIS